MTHGAGGRTAGPYQASEPIWCGCLQPRFPGRVSRPRGDAQVLRTVLRARHCALEMSGVLPTRMESRPNAYANLDLTPPTRKAGAKTGDDPSQGIFFRTSSPRNPLELENVLDINPQSWHNWERHRNRHRVLHPTEGSTSMNPATPRAAPPRNYYAIASSMVPFWRRRLPAAS